MFDPTKYFIQLKGKDYLQVMYRIIWFNEEHPVNEGWQIITEEILDDGAKAKYHAKIINPEGVIIRTASKVEYKEDFYDYAEKAETGAIGRALALAGYGTQFAIELDEGDRIVDSPVEQKKGQKKEANSCISESQIKAIKILESHKKITEDVLEKKYNKKLEELTGIEASEFIKYLNGI